MNKKRRMEKLLISLIDTIIFCNNLRKEDHERANLNTLSNLRALNADIAPPERNIPTYDIMFSIVETITTIQSNKLNLSLAYSIIPIPIIFMNISKKKHQDKMSLIRLRAYDSVGSMGYLSRASTIVLKMINIINKIPK